MASIMYEAGKAVCKVLNGDPVIAADRFSFVFQKRPYNTSRWEPGAFVWAMDPPDLNHENATDQESYKFGATVCHPTEGSLTQGHSRLMSTIERVYHLFRHKSASHLPATFMQLNTKLQEMAEAGEVQQACIFSINSSHRQLFIPAAFEAGYDVCSVVLEVNCTLSRLPAEGL